MCGNLRVRHQRASNDCSLWARRPGAETAGSGWREARSTWSREAYARGGVPGTHGDGWYCSCSCAVHSVLASAFHRAGGFLLAGFRPVVPGYVPRGPGFLRMSQECLLLVTLLLGWFLSGLRFIPCDFCFPATCSACLVCPELASCMCPLTLCPGALLTAYLHVGPCSPSFCSRGPASPALLVVVLPIVALLTTPSGI